MRRCISPSFRSFYERNEKQSKTRHYSYSTVSRSLMVIFFVNYQTIMVCYSLHLHYGEKNEKGPFYDCVPQNNLRLPHRYARYASNKIIEGNGQGGSDFCFILQHTYEVTLRVVFTDQRVIIEKTLFSCPATYPDSSGKLPPRLCEAFSLKYHYSQLSSEQF